MSITSCGVLAAVMAVRAGGVSCAMDAGTADVHVEVGQQPLGVADRVGVMVMPKQQMGPPAGLADPGRRHLKAQRTRIRGEVPHPVLVHNQQTGGPARDADVARAVGEHASPVQLTIVASAAGKSTTPTSSTTATSSTSPSVAVEGASPAAAHTGHHQPWPWWGILALLLIVVLAAGAATRLRGRRKEQP